MKIIKPNHKIILSLLTLMISLNVLSMQQPEQKAINKKDIVDEIDRSAIEENESSEVPKIDNMIPAFEMPNFKANVEGSKKNVSSSQVKKSKKYKPSVKKQKIVARNNNTIKEKKSVKVVTKTQKKTTLVNAPKKVKKKSVIIIKKTLKPGQIFTNDIFIIENGKTVVQRNGKYIYKYRYKSLLPLNSKGLKLIKDNRYQVTDKLQLIADINQAIKAKKNGTDIALEHNSNEALSEEIKKKRIGLAKKYNRGNPITMTITKSRLKPDDVVYAFGEVQMVTRKKSGHHSAKKFWLYPTIDVKSPLLLKTGNGKYKVIKKPQ